LHRQLAQNEVRSRQHSGFVVARASALQLQKQNLWIRASIPQAQGVTVNIKRALLMSGACGILATAVSTALAQQTSEVAEVVIVTGSYIRGTAEDAALPVDVISSEDLAKQGSPSTLEMIKGLSVSNGVLGDTNQFDARAQGSEGSGSVNLRGFGPQRTLVLLNGRRMVASPFLLGAVDTNFIPLAAIGRVEVLKDGAAATYGSDAIGGVVNFITKENLRGLDIGADFKQIEDSDGDYSASGAYGWGNDRMHGLFAVGYQHRSELMVRDRDWAAKEYLENPQGGWSASGNPHSFIPLTAPPLLAPRRDPQCGPLGGFPGTTATGAQVCYWQYTQYDALTEEEDRWQVYGDFSLDIGESVTWRTEAMYADTEIPIYRTSPSYAALQTPSNAANGGVSPVNGQYVVTAANPGWAPFVAANPGFMPAGVTAALLIANRPFALGGNPLFGYDSSEGPRNYDGFRVSTGLSGDISDSLTWDIAATYMEQNATREGRDTVVNRYQLALLGFGGPNCNPAANTPGANGCFFYNPFNNAIPSNPITGAANSQFVAGASNDNRELLEWMFPIVSTEQQTTLMVFDAVLSGQTGLDLPGGAMGWAAGLQYREDKFEATYSDLNNFAVTPCVNSVRTGIIGPTACTPAQLAAPTGALLFLGGANDRDLDRDVSAVFAELSLPITDSFQAQLAARYEDYGGDIGSTFDPKLSLRWQLADAFALRGSVGTTFRGPALAQTDESSVTTLQNVAGTFRAIRTFGDPGLKPESALTFNVGMLLRSGGFTGSVDYWSFDFEDQIVNEPVAGITNFVFGAGATCIGGLANPLAGRFAFRDGGNAAGAGANDGVINDLDCTTANIQRLDINVINGPDVKTDGIDLSAQFDWDMFGGTTTIGANATYVLKYDIDPSVVSGNTVAPAFDAAGKLNYQTVAFPLPQLKGNVFLEYSNGPHNLRYTMNYIDDYVDQRTTEFLPSLATNGIAVTAGKTIDNTMFHDLSYLVQLPWDLTLSATVENFTDEDPSFARLDLSYDPFTSSALGRTYKLGLRMRFGAE
jgi:iron complex outermembrane recepter protein